MSLPFILTRFSEAFGLFFCKNFEYAKWSASADRFLLFARESSERPLADSHLISAAVKPRRGMTCKVRLRGSLLTHWITAAVKPRQGNDIGAERCRNICICSYIRGEQVKPRRGITQERRIQSALIFYKENYSSFTQRTDTPSSFEPAEFLAGDSSPNFETSAELTIVNEVPPYSCG